MNLADLLEWAKSYQMTPEEKKNQIISFVYGNLSIEKPGKYSLAAVEKAYTDLFGVNDDL